MSYGLLSTGPVRKPASQIRSDVVDRIKQIDGFQQARTTTGSKLGNLVDAFNSETSQVWEAWESFVLAFNIDAASGQALDNAMVALGKARVTATYSSVTLHLYSLSGNVVSVPAGNQAEQSSTGTAWETTEDVDIPAYTVQLEDLAVGAVAWQSGTGYTRYSLPASTDLSSVTTSMIAIVTGSANSAVNGVFAITVVDDGSDYIELNNPLITDTSDNEGDSAATLTITNGFITVSAQPTAPGATTGTAQSIDTIATPLTDWDGCANLSAATVGVDTETDAAFRLRVRTELTTSQGSNVEAIVAQLNDVSGVTYTAGSSDDDPSSATYGYAFTVVGGTDQDIIDTIGLYKAGGVPTNGTTSGTYTNPRGVSKTIRFSRVTEINPYFGVELTRDASLYPADATDLIKAAMVALNASLDNGDDVLNHVVEGAITAANIPGILTLTVKQGLSASPSTTANISIADTEVAVITADNITVTIL